VRVQIFQVDAFASRRFTGNPAAVMPLDRFLSDASLQAIAAENNLAETAFLVKAGTDYLIRWFTPTNEVPLCGHATLASAAVVIERLDRGRRAVTFRSASGPLPVYRESEWYVMDFPARLCIPVDTTASIRSAVGTEALEILADEVNYLALLPDAKHVRAFKPDFPAIAALNRKGLIITASGDNGFDFVSRYFTPQQGVPEDPVTGSAHCALAPYWSERLGKNELRAYQASLRGGEVLCRYLKPRVELRGTCAFYLEGEAEV